MEKQEAINAMSKPAEPLGMFGTSPVTTSAADGFTKNKVVINENNMSATRAIIKRSSVL